jgi:CheY-like chemotaxis protein
MVHARLEDDSADARLLHEMLKTEAAPFELVQMSHLSEALQHLGSKRFDVILLGRVDEFVIS